MINLWNFLNSKISHFQVVTKFIKRSKVFEENWVTDNVLGKRVPLEISLLSTLDHPNIVRFLDVHENDDYLQLVMERHGAGMDLFEFLDRKPKMDEALASYIFRQVGVSMLLRSLVISRHVSISHFSKFSKLPIQSYQIHL